MMSRDMYDATRRLHQPPHLFSGETFDYSTPMEIVYGTIDVICASWRT